MAKKKGLDFMHADVHEDEELHVTRTTPQGTQEAGVDKGHEQRDIKVRAIIRWFTGLTVGTIITIFAMVFLVMILTSQDRAEKVRLSSPLYGTDVPRRMPELLPNPQQAEQTLPWDHYRKFVESESKVLTQFGLEDAQGRPALPVSAVNAVTTQPSRGGTLPRDEAMPSEATGGLGESVSILTR